MAATREERTVRLMFSCCACTPEVKLNTYWQMCISSITVCVVDGIASIAALHWVDNFRPCEKYLHLLAKRVGLVTKNVPLGFLATRLGKIRRNRESSKLGLLLDENKDWFAETLQWAVQKKGS